MSRPCLVVATRNVHKLREINAILADLEVTVRGAAEFSGCPEVVEDGDTLEANAEKKAREVAAFTGLLTLADDTGLEVEALDGAPGVYSARWAGEGCSFEDNNRKLLEALRGVPDAARAAHFRCVVALAEPEWGPAPPCDDLAGQTGVRATTPHRGRLELFEGRIEGRIAHEAKGTDGFGYDPVFFIPSENCTLAELPPERKNQISHRAHALLATRRALEQRLRV